MKLTDKDGNELETDNERYIQFAQDMESAGIPWRTYSGRGMFGAECPAACTSERNGISEEDIIRATEVEGLRKDSMGLGRVIYP